MMRRVGRAQKYATKGTASAFAIWALFRLTPKYLRTGLGWANDTIILSTHGTTHVDAPWHYAPVRRAARQNDRSTAAQWFYGDGVVLDMRHKRHGEAITSEDIQSALAPIDYTIKPYDIVLVQTGNDRLQYPCLLQ
jgi:kynurenine formamidase